MKVSKIISGLLALIGAMLILTAAGKIDTGYVAMKDLIPQLLIGIGCIIPSLFAFKEWMVV